MRLRFVFPLIAALALAGCAGMPTPYQPAVDGAGYAEQQLDGRTWRVTFAGNDETPRETVENYLLYRCAEVMLFGGYERFIVLEKVVEPDVRYYAHGYGPSHIGPGIPHGRFSYYHYRYHDPYAYGFTYGAPYRVSSTVRYKASALIQPREGGNPPEGALVLDARALVRQLGPTIVLPNPPAG